MNGPIRLLLILCALPHSKSAFNFAKNWFRVIQFTACNETGPTNIHLTDFKMVEVKDDVIMMGALVVDVDVQGDVAVISSFFHNLLPILPEFQMNLTTTQCDFERRHCEEPGLAGRPMRFERVCSSMKTFNMFGSSFKRDIEPPLTCPFKRGVYKFNNVTANIGIISRFPIGGSLWDAQIKFLDRKDKVVFCANTGIVIKEAQKWTRGRGK
jgi:hypothetical protein